jgi:hypothetical protein
MKLATVVLSCLFGAAFLLAHPGHEGKPITVTGTVVDTGCYLVHDSKGPDHAQCAATCAKNGVPLAILDADGKIYMPIAADHKNPNLKLMDFVEKKVKVTGTSVEKGGVNGIAIKTVEVTE